MHSFCENRLVALIWRLAGLSIGTYGLILMLQASSVKQQLCYFTNQSNLFILILFAGLAVQTAIQIGRNGIHGPVAHTRCGLHLALTLYITITMVCYWALLSWQSFSMAGVKISQFQMKLSNFILHTAVPIFALVDWMLFLPHGRVRPRAAVYFLAYPIAYSIFIALRASADIYMEPSGTPTPLLTRISWVGRSRSWWQRSYCSSTMLWAACSSPWTAG